MAGMPSGFFVQIVRSGRGKEAEWGVKQRFGCGGNMLNNCLLLLWAQLSGPASGLTFLGRPAWRCIYTDVLSGIFCNVRGSFWHRCRHYFVFFFGWLHARLSLTGNDRPFRLPLAKSNLFLGFSVGNQW